MTTGKPWPYDAPRPCAGCLYRASALGIVWCQLDQWAGIANEKRCGQWEKRP